MFGAIMRITWQSTGIGEMQLGEGERDGRAEGIWCSKSKTNQLTAKHTTLTTKKRFFKAQAKNDISSHTRHVGQPQ